MGPGGGEERFMEGQTGLSHEPSQQNTGRTVLMYERQFYVPVLHSKRGTVALIFFLLLYYTTSRLQTISTLPKIFYTLSAWLVEKYPIEYPQLKCSRTCGRCL